MPETVVLVHGIWMTGLEMLPLARRLRTCGYRTQVLRYRSLRRPLDWNARRLVQLVRRQGPGPVHLVGHSLGGLVILQALQDSQDLAAGRVVLLGSPVNGSLIARRLYRRRWSRWLVGRSAEDGLLGTGPRWQGRQSPGVIAGTWPLGLGQLRSSRLPPNPLAPRAHRCRRARRVSCSGCRTWCSRTRTRAAPYRSGRCAACPR